MKKLFLIAVVFVVLFLSQPAAAQQSHPATFIDKGACPFECCTYGPWMVKKDAVLYNKPYKGGRAVGTLKRGSKVRGITGEVRTNVPGRFVVTKPHLRYAAGDVLWVYTPLGEGNYKVWFKGAIYPEEMGYIAMPFETSGFNCNERGDCWGQLENKIQTEWWARVRGPHGLTGWTRQTINFHGIDACGS
jgi:hypothetical protein